MPVRKVKIQGNDSDYSNRKVDVECGAPGNLIGQPSAQRRPEYRRDTPRPGKHALISSALGGGKNIADDGKRQPHHHSAANSLHRAKDNELIHAIQPEKTEFAGGAA